MKREPLVSVVVPMYNSEEYIIDCLNSITKQTYTNIEIIVIDDGSTDHGYLRVSKLKNEDGRIKLIHKTNAGVSASRNTGIDNSKGEYILFVDSDDIIDLNMISKMIELQSDSNFVWCGMEYYYSNGDVHKQCYKGDERNVIQFDEKCLCELFCCLQFSPPVNKMYDARIIKEYNIRFDVDIKLNEDMLFNLRYIKVLKNINGVFINEGLYKYIHRNEQSLTRKLNDNQWDTDNYIFNNIELFFLNDCKIKKDEMMSYYVYCYKNLRNIAFLECENKDKEYVDDWLHFRLDSSEFRKYIQLINRDYKFTKVADLVDYFTLKHKLYMLNWLMKKIKERY